MCMSNINPKHSTINTPKIYKYFIYNCDNPKLIMFFDINYEKMNLVAFYVFLFNIINLFSGIQRGNRATEPWICLYK